MTSPTFPTAADALVGAEPFILPLGFAFQEAWGDQNSLHLNGLFVDEQRSRFSAHKKAWLIHFVVARKPRPVSSATMANFIASLLQTQNSQLQLQNSNGNLFFLSFFSFLLYVQFFISSYVILSLDLM